MHCMLKLICNLELRYSTSNFVCCDCNLSQERFVEHTLNKTYMTYCFLWFEDILHTEQSMHRRDHMSFV